MIEYNFKKNHFFLDVTLLNQVNPYDNPSPVKAHVPWIFQSLPLNWWRPNFYTTSETLITHISCLLAKTNKAASFNSS